MRGARNRIVCEDIAKGIAITCVVVGHSIQFTNLPGMFIMGFFAYVIPFFFLTCGVNYKDKGISYFKSIKKRLSQIFIPLFVCVTFVMVVMGAYFLIRGEATLDDLIHSAEIFWMSKWGAQALGWDTPLIFYQRLLGPCWFILFLITATTFFFMFVSVAIKNLKTLIPTLILLCGSSMLLIHFGVVLPWGIQNAPAIAGLMIFGAYLQKHDFFSDSIKINLKRILISILCIGVFIVIQLCFQRAGLLAAGELGDVVGALEVPILYINAFCGTYFLITLSILLSKLKQLSDFTIWLGRNTFLILIFHLSFIHIVNDILGLSQWNAYDQLFSESFDPLRILVFFAAYGLTCLFVLGINKGLSLIKLKKS